MGVVHRDVKPQNLILFADGTVKVGDFGVARAELHTRTRTANVLGSIQFMAPEQRRDPRAVRPATDVYAVAITLAWLVTGRVPRDLFAPGAKAELEAAGLPEALAEVLVRAGAHEAQDRHRDAGVLAEALKGCGVEGESLPKGWQAAEPSQAVRTMEAEASAARPSLRESPRARTLAWAAGIGLVALLLTAAVSSRAPAPPEPASEGVAGWEDLPACADAPTSYTPTVTPHASDHQPGLREAGQGQWLDVDGDGSLDAVFPHNLDEAFRVYWGDGSGVLPTSGTDAPAIRMAGNVDAGDFNEDGHPDLLATATELSSLVLVLGAPARQFSDSRVFDQFGNPQWTQAVDWDGDGHLDALFNMPVGGTLHWRQGDGHGNLATDRELVSGVEAFDAARRGGSAEMFVLGRDGALRRGAPATNPALVEWETIGTVPPVAGAWVRALTLSGVSGVAVYGVDHGSGGRTRAWWWRPLDGVWTGCSIPDVPRGATDIGDINMDGTLDFLGRQGCSYCTSSYFSLIGRR